MTKRNSSPSGYTLEEAALALRRVYAEHFQHVRREAAMDQDWRRRRRRKVSVRPT